MIAWGIRQKDNSNVFNDIVVYKVLKENLVQKEMETENIPSVVKFNKKEKN